MGSCNSFCSKNASVTQIQPDTQTMLSRKNDHEDDNDDDNDIDTSYGTPHGTPNGTPHGTPQSESEAAPTPPEGELFEEFYDAVKTGNQVMVEMHIDEDPTANLINTKYHE